MSLSSPSRSVPHITSVRFEETNAQQRYATHGIFRYFGKLPPVATRFAIERLQHFSPGSVADIMCGSGTTLVESSMLGVPSIGIDVNPVAILLSRVKTTPLSDPTLLQEAVEHIAHNIASYSSAWKPSTRNLARWFSCNNADQLSRLREGILQFDAPANIRDLLLVAFLATIRKASNASARTGRLFFVEKSDLDVVREWEKRVRTIVEAVTQWTQSVVAPVLGIFERDARRTMLDTGSVDNVFFHPPYFALYRYSSDVLRFELEWLGVDRSSIGRREIRDGFKTTRRDDFFDYMSDLSEVLKEARRIVVRGGTIGIVVNNSTFRNEELPVIDELLERASTLGLQLLELVARETAFTQASYHRSARSDKRTTEDFLVLFKA